MANAFKCDVCGDYFDNSPMIATFIPAKVTRKTLQFDMCPLCSSAVIDTMVARGFPDKPQFNEFYDMIDD